MSHVYYVMPPMMCHVSCMLHVRFLKSCLLATCHAIMSPCHVISHMSCHIPHVMPQRTPIDRRPKPQEGHEISDRGRGHFDVLTDFIYLSFDLEAGKRGPQRLQHADHIEPATHFMKLGFMPLRCRMSCHHAFLEIMSHQFF